MKQFFKFMFASMLGFIIAGVIFFFLVIAFVSALVSSAGDREVVIDDHTVLEITLQNPVKERTSKSPFDDLNFDLTAKRDLGLNDILKNIEKAKDDERIAGIFLRLHGVKAGMAQLEEIRNALVDFKSSKKFIFAYSEDFDQASYYLASTADSIFLNPEGNLDWHGLSTELMFMKGALDKLDIEPEVIRHGKFKSAVEPFVNTSMSPENREQISRLVHGVWDHYLGRVAESRKLDELQIRKAAFEMEVRSPEKAVELRLVDRLAYADEVNQTLRISSGLEEEEKVRLVSLKKYNHARSSSKPFSNKKIAVIYAVGTIQSGDGDENTVGSAKLASAIRKARLDSSIKAIVLRVNSPGGSALASEVIWREVVLARQAKPLIASMSDVAASGGYYIACAADTIVCEPNTVTGSIGVFGLLFNAQKLLNNRLGLTFDTVKTGRFAGLGSVTRPLTEEERGVIQQEVERIYDTFISHVAEGRKMSKERVDSLGQGRIWSGADAKAMGLVDVLGGINTAIEIAARKAGLENYRTLALPEQDDVFQKLMEDLSEEVGVSLVRKNLGVVEPWFEDMQSLLKEQGTLARMPYEISIH